VGTGEWAFEPIEDEQEVELVAGSQGGYHIWVSMRAMGLDPEGVEMELRTQVVDAPEVPPSLSHLRLDLDPTGEPDVYERLGWPARQPRPGCAVDRRVRISLRLTDETGRVASDERVVIPRSAIVAAGDCAQP
jgi:hypothetical protein